MHENVYIVQVRFAGIVDLYAIKAFSREEVTDIFRRHIEKQQIDPTVYKEIYVRLVDREIQLFHSYEIGG